MTEVTDAIKELQQRYESLNIDGITREKDSLNNIIRAVESLKEKLDAVANAQDSIKSIKTELAKSEGIIQTTQATLEGKSALRDKAKETLERMTNWNELLIQAQGSVHKGDNCPICGNIITHVLAPKAESELAHYRQDYDEAEKALQDAKSLIQVNEKLVSNYKKQIAEGENALEKKRSELETHWQQTSRALAQCGKNVDEMPDKPKADQLIIEIEAQVIVVHLHLSVETVFLHGTIHLDLILNI